eukprot:CAMPEP_0195046298 /NCGR_PEP_ID=MMETSP0347-20130606/22856_1 /TAXON_ID=2932 /ORGANISM="Alexandrium fundyense, Strain CCMP1719" /LENGTH=35 /DNA_ID= /DNA_START= /DNA_END= /DNA_ORIENTATION=
MRQSCTAIGTGRKRVLHFMGAGGGEYSSKLAVIAI